MLRYRSMTKFTPEIIQAAIDGYEAQKSRIDSQIAELRGMLTGRSVTPAAAAEAPEAEGGPSKRRRKRRLSAAGREAIAAAARKRWAAFKAAKDAKKKG